MKRDFFSFLLEQGWALYFRVLRDENQTFSIQGNKATNVFFTAQTVTLKHDIIWKK